MKIGSTNIVLIMAFTFLAAAGCTAETRDPSASDTQSAGTDASDAAAGAAAAAPGASASLAADQGGWLDPNSASPDQMLTAPGMTSPAADALVGGRPYMSMSAVDAVLARHLSGQTRDSVYTRIWLPIDLNSASSAEILLIPGVGPRMQHEFEEYRPYRSIEQFRREIGKYVDRDEVARLERYVAIR